MTTGNLKTWLAALGAVFLIIIALTVVFALVGGAWSARGGKVAVVRVEGVITDPTETVKQLRDLEDRDDIKAVVVRIDSPGGAVGPSQEINGAVKRLKAKKKVVASMGAVAASGGYYIACAADRIVANPGTVTGSIGVIIEFVNAEDLLAKIGLKGYVVKSGRFKDTGSPLRKMDREDTELLQGVINDVNEQFVKAVSDGRRLKVEDVRKIADGRILSGAQAKELKLVDTLGDLMDAISLGAELAGIKGKPQTVYIERRGFNLWKSLTGETPAESLSGLLSGFRIMYRIPNQIGKGGAF